MPLSGYLTWYLFSTHLLIHPVSKWHQCFFEGGFYSKQFANYLSSVQASVSTLLILGTYAQEGLWYLSYVRVTVLVLCVCLSAGANLWTGASRRLTEGTCGYFSQN